MFTVALTGGIGCGKSAVSQIFAELGVPIIDLDVISHQLTATKQPLLSIIATTFGKQLITADGSLDRDALRRMIFSDNDARAQLNAILHPAIYKQAAKELKAQSQAHYAILAIPLLYGNTSYSTLIDRVLVVDCDETIQIARVKERSHLSTQEIKKIIKAQASREERLSIADDVVENNKDVANLHVEIRKLHQKYVNTCIVSKTIS